MVVFVCSLFFFLFFAVVLFCLFCFVFVLLCLRNNVLDAFHVIILISKNAQTFNTNNL